MFWTKREDGNCIQHFSSVGGWMIEEHNISTFFSLNRLDAPDRYEYCGISHDNINELKGYVAVVIRNE